MTRGYIEKEAKMLKPTDLAMVVTDMLVENFSDIVDYKFTAEMEDKLIVLRKENLNGFRWLENFIRRSIRL